MPTPLGISHCKLLCGGPTEETGTIPMLFHPDPPQHPGASVVSHDSVSKAAETSISNNGDAFFFSIWRWKSKNLLNCVYPKHLPGARLKKSRAYVSSNYFLSSYDTHYFFNNCSPEGKVLDMSLNAQDLPKDVFLSKGLLTTCFKDSGKKKPSFIWETFLNLWIKGTCDICPYNFRPSALEQHWLLHLQHAECEMHAEMWCKK